MIPPVVVDKKANYAYDIYSRLLNDGIIILDEDINHRTSSLVITQLLYLESINKDKPIYLYINSPGGSIDDGLAIIDTMNIIKNKVYTICMGMCASMAAVILAAGEKGHRYALPHSRIMIHQPLGGTRGQSVDIKIYADEIIRMKNTLVELLSEYTGKDKESIEKDIDRDFYMTSQDAINYGIIDKILKKK